MTWQATSARAYRHRREIHGEARRGGGGALSVRRLRALHSRLHPVWRRSLGMMRCCVCAFLVECHAAL